MNMEENKVAVSKEQRVYADWLHVGMLIGLITLIVCFAIYLSGLFPPSIPLAEISDYWCLPLAEYLEQTGYEAGWSWTKMLPQGDYLTFVAVVILAGISIICYMRILPVFVSKRNKPYAIIAILEIILLILAASGILTTGH